MSSRNASERFVPLALGVAIASISFAAIFFRQAAPTHPLVIAGTRLGLASLALAWPTWRAWRAGRLPLSVIKRAAVGGLLYGVHFGTWVSSLTMTSVASSVTLVTATPLLLALLSTLTGRDHPERRHWISIGLAIVGLSLIGWADLSLSREALIGDGLALSGAVAMALYLLLVRGMGEELDVLAFSGITTAVGAVSLLYAAVALHVPVVFASVESFGWVALAALFPQLVGHNLLSWSLRHATPTAVGIATVGEPVGSTFFAWVWLGERVGPMVAGGCAITLLAVVVSLRRGRRADDADVGSVRPSER